MRSGKSSAGKQSQQKNLQRKKNIQDLVWHFYPNVDFENFFKTILDFGWNTWIISLPSDSQTKFWPEMLNNIKDEMQQTDIKDTDGTDI